MGLSHALQGHVTLPAVIPVDLAAASACGMALATPRHRDTLLCPLGVSEAPRQKNAHHGLLDRPAVLCQ